MMQRRHQWCALAAGGDVAAAEVRHHVDAGEFGQQRRMLALARVADAVVQAGPVPDGLAMRADGSDRGGWHAGLAQQRGHACGVDPGQRIGRQCLAVDLVLARLLQGAVCGAQRLGEGFAGGGQYLRPRAAEIDQHRIGTIHAGAGHDADIAFAAWHGRGHGRRVSWRRSARCRHAAH
ncbi:hypothetical protein D3C81_1442810 [compost metagenome]